MGGDRKITTKPNAQDNHSSCPQTKICSTDENIAVIQDECSAYMIMLLSGYTHYVLPFP